MVFAWPEPPSVMSAEKFAGVRDGVEALAFGITEISALGLTGSALRFMCQTPCREARCVAWPSTEAISSAPSRQRSAVLIH